MLDVRLVAHAALEAVQVPLFWVAPPEGRFVYANPAGLRLLGYDREELLNLTVPDIDPNWSADYFQSEDGWLRLKREQLSRFETRIRRKDGTTFTAELSISYAGVDGQEVFFVVPQDITDRKEAESALREANRFAQNVIESVPGGVYIFDLVDRKVVYASDPAVKSIGYTPAELKGMGERLVETIHHPDELPRIATEEADWRRPGTDNQVRTSLRRMKSKKGEWHWFQLYRRPFQRDEDGLVRQLIGVGHDITEQKQAEESLRRERDRAQGYLDLAGAMFVALNVDGTVAMVNPRACKVLGCRVEELVGLNWFDTVIPNRIRQDMKERFGRIVRGEIGPTEFYENPVMTKNGEEREIAWHNTILRDDAGSISGTLSSGEDITDRKRAEQALREALEEIKALKDRAEAENLYLREEVRRSEGFEGIVGESDALLGLLRSVEQAAPTDVGVLILGETGTGKEMVARALHSRSRRSGLPFVKVDCSALPETLIESALFGHEKGAFTGAVAKATGRFELADGGTIFLDEVGELSPEIQAKLLRILQDGEFERVGSAEVRRVDVRVIAATNRDLESAVRAGRFREDLYYRLRVFPMTVPPLRDRRNDIPLLVWHFLFRSTEKLRKKIERVPREIMDALVAYDWPGNVRELQNVVERAVILSPGSMLLLDRSVFGMKGAGGATISPNRRMEDVERDHILRVVKESNWKIRGKGNAAERLGMNPSTLRSRMKKLGIRRPGY